MVTEYDENRRTSVRSTAFDHVEAMAGGKIALNQSTQEALRREKINRPVGSLTVSEEIGLLARVYGEVRASASNHYFETHGKHKLHDDDHVEEKKVWRAIGGPRLSDSDLTSVLNNLKWVESAVELLDAQASAEPASQSDRQLKRILPHALVGWREKYISAMARIAADWQSNIAEVLQTHDGAPMAGKTKEYLEGAASIAQLASAKIAELQSSYQTVQVAP